MSTPITGPRALSAFKLEQLQTAEGRAEQVGALCAVARRTFETQGRVQLLSWIWVQQTPDGTPAPAILAVELVGELDSARLDAFQARVLKACELGKALAVATVAEHEVVQVLFESHAGSALHCAPIRTGSDPLDPTKSRRVLDPFREEEHAPDRFLSYLAK